MSQINTGIRSILAFPSIYKAFQCLISNNSVQKLINDHIRPTEEDLIFDVGCGPGHLIESLPRNVKYIGFDLSEKYISEAKSKYPDKTFYCSNVSEFPYDNIEKPDIVLVIGLAHHLDDNEFRKLLIDLKNISKPGTRIILFDPCYHDKQNILARKIVSFDRGQNVRDDKSYKLIVETVFQNVSFSIREDLMRIPYSHCVAECTR